MEVETQGSRSEVKGEQGQERRTNIKGGKLQS